MISTQTKIWQNELNSNIFWSKSESILKITKNGKPDQNKRDTPHKCKISKSDAGQTCGMFGTSPGTPPGHLRDISRTSPGHLRDNSGTSPGHLRNISGTTPGHLRDKFDENFRNFSPKTTFHLVLFPLEGANAIFEFPAESCRLCLVYLDASALQVKSPNIRRIGPSSFTLAAQMFARFVFRFKMK